MSTGYLIVIEGDDDSGYSSYSPDLPGVIAAADTRDECEKLMREAIAFHIEGLIEDGEPVPPPTNAARSSSSTQLPELLAPASLRSMNDETLSEGY